MPISSPSYFPPQRGNRSIVGQTAGLQMLGARNFLAGQSAGKFTTLDDLIVVGDTAFSAGVSGARITDTFLAGATIVGSQAAKLITRATNNAVGDSSLVVIGRNALAAAVAGDSLVVIGDGALKQFTGAAAATGPNRIVCIGAQAMAGLTGTSQCDGITAIGYRALGWTGNVAATAVNTVCIGNSAMANAGTFVTNCVVIGTSAAINGGQTTGGIQSCVAIGSGVSLDNGDNCTIVGTTAGVTSTGVGNQARNTVIGASATAYGIDCTIIGQSATNCPGGAGTVGSGHIIIGRQAGVLLPNNLTDILYIGTFNSGGSGVERCAIYGVMAQGNLIFGRSTNGTDRDFRGTTQPTNAVKLVNGTVGTGANPTGGGFFYASGGELHWLSSAGKDTALTSAVTTVAGLPAASAGQQNDRRMVTDANSTVYASIVAGGGANIVPVFCDGTNWRIG